MLVKKLTRIGNSLAVIIPKAILDQFEWDEKSEIRLEHRQGELVLTARKQEPNLFGDDDVDS